MSAEGGIASPVATITPTEPQVPSETERLDPQAGVLTLSTGTIVELERMRMRQLFKLLRVVTRGGATMLGGIQLSPNMPQEEFAAQFLALLMFSLPEADDEAVEFLRSMVRPKTEFSEGSKPYQDVAAQLYAELENPELDDVVTIVQEIVTREAADLQALGKRVMTAWTLATKTGQMPSPKPN